MSSVGKTSRKRGLYRQINKNKRAINEIERQQKKIKKMRKELDAVRKYLKAQPKPKTTPKPQRRRKGTRWI